MDLIEGIKTRRSIRKFTDKPIEPVILRKIMEATAYAPSWKNTQVARYTIVEDRDIIAAIANQGVLGFSFNTKTMLRSKLLAVQTVVTGICGREKDGTFTTSKGSSWEMYDAGVSAQTFCLAAHEYGVGTVIMGVVDEVKVKELLHIPADQTVTAVIAMGYYEGEHAVPTRKSVEELMNFIPAKKKCL